MKVYNKKGLIWGIVWSAVAVINLIFELSSPSSTTVEFVSNIFWPIVLMGIGITGFIRAFSKRATEEDIAFEKAEKKSLAKLRGKAKTLDILCCVSFIVMLLSMFAWKMTGQELLVGIVVLAGLSIPFILITELIAEIYYSSKEGKNKYE